MGSAVGSLGQPPSERIFLGLGSNLGALEANLREALERVGRLPGTRVVRVSRFRETEPWGVIDQPRFLNAVAEITSEMEPDALLDAVKRIEQEMGREPARRWGPRLIDIDLLLYGVRCWNSPRLILPHPRILERPFVWEPLAEIAPEILEELRRASISL